MNPPQAREGLPADAVPAAAAAEAVGAAADVAADVEAAAVDARAANYRDAAKLLEDGDGVPIRELTLAMFVYRRAGQRQDEAEEARVVLDFRRFVNALGQKTGGDRRAVRRISFVGVDWRALPHTAAHDDVRRLFTHVLPLHPTLVSITFERCEMSSHHLTWFAESLPTDRVPPLEDFVFRSTIDWQGAKAIATMLRRNVTLSNLDVSSSRSWNGWTTAMRPNWCYRICRAVPHNTSLRTLSIRAQEVTADAMEKVGSSSSLRSLAVDSFIPNCSVTSLARQLRTNTALRTLRLILRMRNREEPRWSNDPFGPIVVLLETYNFTLSNVALSVAFEDTDTTSSDYQRRVNELVRRNKHIQRALSMLERPGSAGEGREILWPAVVATAGRVPTLLYRFLRRGDADELCRLVLPTSLYRMLRRGDAVGLCRRLVRRHGGAPNRKKRSREANA